VAITTDQRHQSLVSEWVVEEAQGGLDLENPAARVVDSGYGDDSVGNSGIHGANESLVLEGDHDHVEAGIDGQAYGSLEIRVELAHAQPIGDEEALKTQLAFQQIGEQISVRVQLQAVPAALFFY